MRDRRGGGGPDATYVRGESRVEDEREGRSRRRMRRRTTSSCGGGTNPPATTAMYSSFLAHPTADGAILDELHSALYGGSLSSSSLSGNERTTTWHHPRSRVGSGGGKRPSHAYGPPYGPHRHVHRRATSSNGSYGGTTSLDGAARGGMMMSSVCDTRIRRPEEDHCMGITSIFEASTPASGGGGG